MRRLLDGLSDTDVGAATTYVAGHRIVYLPVSRIGTAREQSRGRHNLTRLTVATLDHLEVLPGSLDPPTDRRLSNSLDRRDRRITNAVDLGDAGAYGVSVLMDGARSAQCFTASKLRSGHTQDIAQYPKKGRVAIHIDGMLHSVHVYVVHYEFPQR
jgi:hypothetical protein